MAPYTIRQIQTGWQFLDKGQYATYGQGHGQVIKHPVFSFLIEGEGNRILVDTGMSDTEHSVRFHHDGLQEQGQAIQDQLAKVGLEPDDVDIVIFTHLHWDHCYNLDKFQRPRLLVSDAEYRFALDPIPFYWKSYEAPQTGLVRPFEGRKFELLRGDEEITKGVRVFPTPGHSVGHLAVEVDTSSGKYVIAGDLAYLIENFERDEARGWPLTPPGRFANIVDWWRSMELVKERADHILLSHDPKQLAKETYP